jgi:hypothetical protein
MPANCLVGGICVAVVHLYYPVLSFITGVIIGAQKKFSTTPSVDVGNGTWGEVSSHLSHLDVLTSYAETTYNDTSD